MENHIVLVYLQHLSSSHRVILGVNSVIFSTLNVLILYKEKRRTVFKISVSPEVPALPLTCYDVLSILLNL
jgi:hypothetical protein